MSSTKNKDLFFLTHIVDSIEKIEQLLPTISYESFVSEWQIHDAVIRNLEIIGEATNHVSEKLKEEFHNVTWKDAVGMRNFLIHEYFGIDFQVVWSTLTNDLPIFKNDIKKIIKENF